MDSWRLRASPPPALVRPVSIDPTGREGPTKGAAAGPRWRRTSRGLYVEATVDRSCVEQRILEESCRLPPLGAVSGWAALRLHGAGYCDGLAADGRTPEPVPLVLPPCTNLAPGPGATLHRERLSPTEVLEVHGIPTTHPCRATFDAARWSPDLRSAVVVLDMALAAGVVAAGQVQNYLTSRAGWPGLRRVTRALALSDARSMSPQESSLRLIWMIDARLPRPRCNWPISDGDGRHLGKPDLLCEDLAVVGEFDGAEHRGRARHRDDLRRDDAFRAVGLEPFRVVGADLGDRDLVLARIASAIERSRVSTVPRTWRRQANPPPVR